MFQEKKIIKEIIINFPEIINTIVFPQNFLITENDKNDFYKKNKNLIKEFLIKIEVNANLSLESKIS